MSVLKFDYRDENWEPTDRAHAVFDPHGRRMDECITLDCHNVPKYYLVTVDGMDMHTRVCDTCLPPLEIREMYDMRPDPEIAA